MTRTLAKPVVDDDALYIGDNGAVACGKHLGNTARYSYRDLSGQVLHKVTPRDHRVAKSEGWTIACEACTSAARKARKAEQMVLEVCERCGEPWTGGGRCADCERGYGPVVDDDGEEL